MPENTFLRYFFQPVFLTGGGSEVIVRTKFGNEEEAASASPRRVEHLSLPSSRGIVFPKSTCQASQGETPQLR